MGELEIALNKLNPNDQAQYVGPCDQCGDNLTGFEDFKVHLRKHYLDAQRKFKCEICGKTYTTLYNLKAHKEIHIGEKKYSCQYCNKKFLRKYDMKRHEAGHICQ